MFDRFRQNNNGNDEFREPDPPQTSSDSYPDPSVLENVLEETIASDADVISPEQLEALKQVARDHKTTEFGLEPIGVCMAEAILSARYSEYTATDPHWQTMSRQVAESMFDVDHIRNRIQELWERLCESTR